jgi:hypothetical protein
MITWCCLDDNLSFLDVFFSQQQRTKMTSPVLPILGSTLLQLINDKAQSGKRKQVGTSFDLIDSALRGGVDYGRISCISGDKGMGKTTVGFSCALNSQIWSRLSNVLLNLEIDHHSYYFRLSKCTLKTCSYLFSLRRYQFTSWSLTCSRHQTLKQLW